MKRLVILLAISVSLVAVQASWGGWLDNVMENAAKRATERVVDRAARESSDAAYDKAKEGAKNGSEDSGTSDSRSSGRGSSSHRGDDYSQVGSDSSSGTAPVDEKIYRNYDFIPGDKVIFFDDFSDTDVGEFPRKWTLNGGGGGTPLEVVEVGGQKYLSCSNNNKHYSTTALVRWAGNLNLPEKFTVEFDAKFAPYTNRPQTYQVHFPSKERGGRYSYTHGNSLEFNSLGAKSEHGGTENKIGDNRFHRISISVNGTFVKAYIDENRVINDPDGVKLPIRYVGITAAGSEIQRMLLTNFRIAEGGKTIKSALATDGRIVAHGITFDSGSDRIRPESTSTLREILSLLEDDASLTFEVQGHTDNTGNSSANQTLSEDRADAVRRWLVDQGIDGGRLTTKGFGDSKPMSSNDSPEGRANNRRVEFVKL